MNDEQRSQIRSNAQYLREVRPIDPDEIFEYVEGQPHPAAVRQVLREEAVDLGLLECEDGTFEPVPSGSVDVDFDGVGAFPERYARVLEDLLVAEYGPGWPGGESGERLRANVRATKKAYLDGTAVEYDYETALAYAVYHLPDYYAAVQYVLAALAEDGLLPRRLRVLDVGAGVGGPALGLVDLLPDDSLLEYHAVEPSAAADVLESMLGETDANVHATVHRETAESFAPDGQYDLVLFGNVLRELDDPAAVVRRLGKSLHPDGSVVALAPADRNTATNLRAVERTVADDGPFTVYAPTVRLWPGERPTDDMWSFDVQADVDVPPFQRRLEDEASADSPGQETDDPTRKSEFVNVDVQYAYSVLRTDGRKRIEVDLDPESAVKFADTESVVTERVDCYAVKLSQDLSDGGNPLFRVGDGSQSTGHFAVLTEESILNRDLEAAAYGDLLVFENVLVLWNDDEGAYNLVVGGETVVDSVAV
jgi:2-polyprenyl-3-methyl-5-hydroxy-6-metoxy-1,4-benzoquinol methylase